MAHYWKMWWAKLSLLLRVRQELNKNDEWLEIEEEVNNWNGARRRISLSEGFDISWQVSPSALDPYLEMGRLRKHIASHETPSLVSLTPHERNDDDGGDVADEVPATPHDLFFCYLCFFLYYFWVAILLFDLNCGRLKYKSFI